jgi:hypothetical protein
VGPVTQQAVGIPNVADHLGVSGLTKKVACKKEFIIKME